MPLTRISLDDSQDPDDDNDGLSDDEEGRLGTNPQDADSKPGGPADLDRDGIPDDLDQDDDGDGIWDEVETAGGTDPYNAESGKARPFQVDKLRMKALFTTAGRDSVSMKAIIPDIPAGFNPDGARLELDVAGGIVLFTLDKSGAAVSSNGWVRMKLKSTINEETGTREFAGGAVPVMLKLNGSWAEAWSAQGFGPDTDAKNMAMTVTVTMLFNGGNYEASVKGAYSCKAGKSATFKQ